MKLERWQEIKRLLVASTEIPSEERSRWLAEHCGDVELRREVESLLVHDEERETFSHAGLLKEWLAAGEPATVGRRIGHFHLVELLGCGGMGEVYLAEREEGFEQRAALKLMRHGFEGSGARERFHRERQILARLEHPNIARLIDGGASDDGRPYFVMELVDGVPIDTYCDQHRLGVKERLTLTLQVCEALQFAHRHLIVHRDLKPGNILVTREGTVKLLDFGIAKILDSAGGQTLAATAVGQQPMTLRYASPEQLREEAITTASDIYSLGVVIHELLTGRLPAGLETKSSFGVIQAVCNQEPRPLSQEIHLLSEDALRKRDTSAAALKRQLRGDVNAIVLKALRKDPAERYASVEQLANDIERHLSNFPVRARQGTWIYLISRYLRRHRWGLAFIALILAFTLALAHQLERTERQRSRAVRISSFLVELFRAVEPDRQGEEPHIRDLIELGRERLETELEEEPEVRAELLSTLGEVSSRLGHHAAAAEALNSALASLRRLHRGDHPDLARTLNDLAVIHYQRGEIALAEDLARQAIAMRERLGVASERLKPQNTLAAILMLRGELDEAEAIYRQVLDERRAILGDDHPNVATSLRSLATVLYLRGDLAAAEPLLLEALELRIAAFDRDSPAVATALASLGRLSHAKGQLDAALAFYREALDIRRRHLGTDHLQVATLETDLAALQLDRGEIAEAGALLERALEKIRLRKDENDWRRAEAESIYGAYLAALGRFAEAGPLLDAAYRRLREVRGPNVLPTRQALQRLESLAE